MSAQGALGRFNGDEDLAPRLRAEHDMKIRSGASCVRVGRARQVCGQAASHQSRAYVIRLAVTVIR